MGIYKRPLAIFKYRAYSTHDSEILMARPVFLSDPDLFGKKILGPVHGVKHVSIIDKQVIAIFICTDLAYVTVSIAIHFFFTWIWLAIC